MRARFRCGEESKFAHQTLSMLLMSGADPNATDYRDRSALSLLSDSSHNIDTVKLLLSLGADVQMLDQAGRTALHYAAS